MMQKKKRRQKKMNLKTKVLMTLLLTVLMPMLSAQTLNTNNKIYENELGIDLTKTYSGNEVNEIIGIILEECDYSIDQAYKKGYKQATVELQPEIEYWKTMYESKKDNKNILQYSLISLGTGFLIGSFTGISLGLKIPIN